MTSEAIVQTLLASAAQSAIVPVPRTPGRTPPAANLKLTPTLAQAPVLLRTELNDLLAGGSRTLEVDVSDVPVLPAAALQSLVDADATLRRRGGQVRLHNLTPRSIRVLAASKTLHLAGN